MTTAHLLETAGLGLAAGLVGGLAGIGGSLVMLPGLALILGTTGGSHSEQHVFAAAAMAVNVVVALPASLRHAKAGAVRRDLVALLLPAMAVAIVVGVLVSNRVSGTVLRLLLALFIVAYCCWNIAILLRRRAQAESDAEHATTPIVLGIGGVSGFAAGLLGIGGGAVIVPALQLLGRVRLRHAIGTSNAAMVGSAAIGATLKWATLGEHGRSWTEAALIGAAMAPGAMLGGTAGATLAQRLPLRIVRLAVSCLLLVVAARLVIAR